MFHCPIRGPYFGSPSDDRKMWFEGGADFKGRLAGRKRPSDLLTMCRQVLRQLALQESLHEAW